MELRKSQNMIDHEAEIFSRPARTWFQSEKERSKAAGSLHGFTEESALTAAMSLFIAVSKQHHEHSTATSASSRKNATSEDVSKVSAEV